MGGKETRMEGRRELESAAASGVHCALWHARPLHIATPIGTIVCIPCVDLQSCSPSSIRIPYFPRVQVPHPFPV